MFGVVQQKSGYLTHMNRSLMQGPLVVTSLAILKSPRGTDFIVLTIVRKLLRQEMLSPLRMMRSVGVRIHEKWILMKYNLILLLALLYQA